MKKANTSIFQIINKKDFGPFFVSKTFLKSLKKSHFCNMNYCIIDVETTGGNPKGSKITEIAIYKHDGQSVIDEFVSLVNPECEIPEFISRLTGINDKMVANAPKFFEIAKQIIDFTSDSIFVAHNVSFDYSMIRSEFKRLGYDYRREQICTVRAARYVIPGHASYSLGKISNDLGIKINGRHRAGGDAFATVQLFDILLKKDKNNLQGFLQQELNTSLLHPDFNPDVIDEMPNKTGVFSFYNDCNQIIFVGKSKNIKSRVEQHLRNTKTKKGAQMREEIIRIEYELTGNELVAELLEDRWIKQYKPKYNIKNKKNKYPYGLYSSHALNDEGYIHLKVALTKDESQLPITAYATKKEGINHLTKLCKEYALCQKLCHLSPTEKHCSNYEEKKCFGACVEKETYTTYNARIKNLIQDISLENESFYLLEKGRSKLEKCLLYMENGEYIGNGYIPFNKMKKGPKFWRHFIDRQHDNASAKAIIQLYMRKNEVEKVIV